MDIDHKRLFTYGSFQGMFKQCGFKVKKTIPIPPPFKLLSRSVFSDILTAIFNLLNKIAPGLFSFQIIKVAVPLPTSASVIQSQLLKYE
jgi:hypothetical protein